MRRRGECGSRGSIAWAFAEQLVAPSINSAVAACCQLPDRMCRMFIGTSPALVAPAWGCLQEVCHGFYPRSPLALDRASSPDLHDRFTVAGTAPTNSLDRGRSGTRSSWYDPAGWRSTLRLSAFRPARPTRRSDNKARTCSWRLARVRADGNDQYGHG